MWFMFHKTPQYQNSSVFQGITSRSLDTSGDIQTTQQHIPEDRTLYKHRSENLKFYIPNNRFTENLTSRYGIVTKRQTDQQTRQTNRSIFRIAL